MTTLAIFLKIIVSAFLGGLIGVEREIHGCAAGLRTHILVCVGSTLFMMTSIFVAIEYGDPGSVDAARIAAGVVTGIGFLGAGAIIRYGSSVHGLTTAASIWAVAALGLAVGAGMYEAAIITTLVVLAILILARFEKHMILKRQGRRLVVDLFSESENSTEEIKKIIETYGGSVRKVTQKQNEKRRRIHVVFDLLLSRIYCKHIVTEINSLSGVENAKWK